MRTVGEVSGFRVSKSPSLARTLSGALPTGLIVCCALVNVSSLELRRAGEIRCRNHRSGAEKRRHQKLHEERGGGE